MPNNLFANVPAAVVAKQTIDFIAAGITETNTAIIFEVGSPLKSYVPGRSINAVTGFTSEKGYYFVPKVDMDLSAILIPPIPDAGSLPQLAMPAGLVASSGAGQIGLNWDDVADATGYEVMRNTVNNVIGSVSVGTPSLSNFTNTGLGNGLSFYYFVRAIAPGFEPSDWASVNGTTYAQLAAPVPGAGTPGAGTMSFNWADVSGANNYIVKRNTVNTESTATQVYSGAVSAFNDTGLTNGVTYYYFFKSQGASAVDSTWSTANGVPAGLPTSNLVGEWISTTGVTTGGGGVVEGWAEKNGNGKDWAFSGTKPPAVGVNGIDFGTSGNPNMKLAAPIALGAFTLYFRINPQAAEWEIFAGSENGSYGIYTDGVSRTDFSPNTGVVGLRSTFNLIPNGECVMAIGWDGTDTGPAFIFRNGVDISGGFGGWGNNSPIGTGWPFQALGGENDDSGFNFKGFIKRVRLYDTLHSADDIIANSALM